MLYVIHVWQATSGRVVVRTPQRGVPTKAALAIVEAGWRTRSLSTARTHRRFWNEFKRLSAHL
jgi:hypothetical protein